MQQCGPAGRRSSPAGGAGRDAVPRRRAASRSAAGQGFQPRHLPLPVAGAFAGCSRAAAGAHGVPARCNIIAGALGELRSGRDGPTKALPLPARRTRTAAGPCQCAAICAAPGGGGQGEQGRTDAARGAAGQPGSPVQRVQQRRGQAGAAEAAGGQQPSAYLMHATSLRRHASSPSRAPPLRPLRVLPVPAPRSPLTRP